MLSHASNQASICSSHCFLIPFFEPEIKADDVAIEFISANFAKILLPLWVSRGLRVWSRNSISLGWIWIWWKSLLSMFRIPQQHRGDKWMQFSSKPKPNHVNVNQSKTHISAKDEIQPPKSPKCFFFMAPWYRISQPSELRCSKKNFARVKSPTWWIDLPFFLNN